MQYFEAVQQGKRRAAKSQMRLFEIAGFAMLTLTTKKVGGRFAPVGEEDYAAVIRSPDGYVALLVDGDGCTKAQTRAGGEGEAMEVYRKAREAGIPEYAGGQVSIWNDAYPTVQGGGPAGGGEA